MTSNRDTRCGNSVARFFALIAMVAVTTLGSAGCSQDSVALTATTDTRAPVKRDGGYEVTVPALWADSKSATSGTEPARIWATTSGASRFTIDLADLRAKGAGAQWTAASAAAAAVGSMVSGVNPGRIDVDFAITGPIDGPSAGGILTVGVLSALLNAPIRGDMTMTGTISPDGSIGPIGGVDLKLKAAAAQGYSLVLLPLANMSLRDGTTNSVISAVDAGRALGLEVRGVGNVQEAFTLFTDGKYSYSQTTPFALPPAVAAVAGRQTTELLARLSSSVKDSAKGADMAVPSALLTEAESRAQAGETAVAYGIATQGLYVSGREHAAALLRDDGSVSARTELSTEIGSQRDRIQRLKSTIVPMLSSLGYEQLISAPNALSWLTYDTAILDVLQSRLVSRDIDQATAERYARILADTRTDLDVLFPDQAEILASAPGQPSPGESTIAEYLSDYTNFLVRAGQAQQDYVETVVLRGEDPLKVSDYNDVGLLLPVVLELAESLVSISAGTGSLPEELVQASAAITYYVAASSLIAAVQGFGIDQFGIGSDASSAESPLVLEAAVTTAAAAVTQVTGLLGERGLDASLPAWGASTSAGAAQALKGSSQKTALDVRALNELYFDSINAFMLQSGPVP